jgi:hypothetical protein
MKKSAQIADRLIKLSNDDQLSIGDEFRILEHLVNRFNLISLSEYAKKEGISNVAARKRIDTGKECFIELAGKICILP